MFAPGSGYVVCTAVQGLSGAGDAACSLSRRGSSWAIRAMKGSWPDVKAGRSNTVNYVSLSGERMLGFYTLLGINDWYIMSVIPESERVAAAVGGTCERVVADGAEAWCCWAVRWRRP